MSLAQPQIDRLFAMTREAFASSTPTIVLGGSDANLVLRPVEALAASASEAPIAAASVAPAEVKARAATSAAS